jgi:hypothetical protein
VEQASRSKLEWSGAERRFYGVARCEQVVRTVGAVDGARVAPPLFDRGTVAGGRYRADTSGLV